MRGVDNLASGSRLTKMSGKGIYIITGVAFLFFSLVGLRRDIDGYRTQLYGEVITVTIIHVPRGISSKAPKALRFEYDDHGQKKEYAVQVRSSYDDYYLGQEVRMKVDLEKKIFLFENGDMRGEFYAAGISFLFGAIMLIYGLKKNRART